MELSEQEILQTLMRWRTRVSAAAWLVVRDGHAAEDIFQDVALKALTQNGVFESEGALLSWAFIAARRKGIDWLRRHRRETSGLDPDILELLEHEWLSQNKRPVGARMDALKDCLESVPSQSREMLRLRYFEGYACEDVAARMNTGLNAIYKRISRLHQSLKNCIETRLGNSQEQSYD